MIGRQFARLTVVARAPNQNNKQRWVCSCECGGETIASAWSLKAGRSRSCGCFKAEQLNEAQGHDNHSLIRTPEYDEWLRIKSRCNYPRNRAYHNYGGKGIRVCPEWMDSFLFFLADVGPRPTPYHVIGRRDETADFTPKNCEWVVSKRRLKLSANAEAVGQRERDHSS